ncbi:MAG: hypothetical protein RH949_16030 [Coleofasciculus sp. A1-SPW-01]|uniref:hypothetical protein n=1 Tax=Coleofasciculus sp. A1-SPW-01 TaxID=3070819 RepID=UPI0032F6C29D
MCSKPYVETRHGASGTMVPKVLIDVSTAITKKRRSPSLVERELKAIAHSYLSVALIK